MFIGLFYKGKFKNKNIKIIKLNKSIGQLSDIKDYPL